MKKRKLKLELNKVEISNLSTIKGGNGSDVNTCQETVSRNFIDICCPIFGSDDCPDTNLTTCHTSASGQNSEVLNCTRTVDTACSMQC